MEAYASALARDSFASSREYFDAIVQDLSDPKDGRTHTDLEDSLTSYSQELMRRLLQDHLDLRTVREARREQVTGTDGIRRASVEQGHERSLVTVFGEVRVTRQAYRAKGARNAYPTDGELNLPVELHSLGLRRLAVFEGVRGSFADASAAIERARGVRVATRQIEQLTRAAAADVALFYSTRCPSPVGTDDLLILQMDGKGVVMRPEALREDTAKKAAEAKPKLATRTSRGEKRNRKRMAEVGAVYDAAPVPRAPEQVITLGSDGEHVKGPKARGKWLTASVTEDAATVIGEVFDEAERRDPGHKRSWGAVVDGNNHQIERIKAQATARKVTVPILIDFIHVLEYLWASAWCFFAEGTKAAEEWVAAHARRILAGRSDLVVAALRRKATRHGLVPDKRARLEKTITYLVNKRPYLRYDQALEQGWPIASGVIEGACRHLIKDRMEITGARWGLAGAEAVLQLRAVISNGDFDEYWTFHMRQQHQRVHGPRYQEAYALAA